MAIRSASRERLEDVFLNRKLAAEARVRGWIREAQDEEISFEEVVLRDGAFSRRQLLQVLENQTFCPAVDLTVETVDPDLAGRVSAELARRHDAVPVRRDGDRVLVAMANPDDEDALAALQVALHAQVVPRVSLRCDIRDQREMFCAPAAPRRDAAAREAARDAAAGAEADDDGEGLSDDARAARRRAARIDLKKCEAPEIVDRVLAAAIQRGATDVHFNPADGALMVRLRVDGILQTVARIPEKRKASVIARLKVTSDLDIAEHRVPQDGRQTLQVGNDTIDLRVSTLPSQFGENVVIRLLRKDTRLLDLERLEMPPAVREAHRDMVNSPLGFYLVTGPTGSGKTTTLYATLNALDREQQNVITLEDPIEYSLRGITQVPIKEAAGLSFAAGLRSILRQDPDVVLVGEIRDLETVEIACRAALTGHKVLSTLHTNDACQAVTRLLDMGLPPFLLTATLRGVLAQRLIRVLCPDCREPYAPGERELALLGYPKEAELWRGSGCDACAGTGYRGRQALFEYFRIDENLHRHILDRASPFTLRHAARRNGMVSMADFAKKAVLEGRTTVEEIQRVLFDTDTGEQLCRHCERVVSADFSVCPFCQQNLKERCGKCGSTVDPDWEACPNCGDELEREWERLFCRSCLAPVDAAWSTCQYCGEGL